MKYFIDENVEKLFLQSKLIILDMNGLIIDDEELQLEAFNKVLKIFDKNITEEYWSDFCVGRKTIDFLSEILIQKDILCNEKELLYLVHRKNEYYKNILKKRIKKLIRPGVLSMIEFIKTQSRQKLALCSSASNLEIGLVLKGINLDTVFDFIISGDGVKKGKPDPEIYMKGLSISAMKPEECLAFEDAQAGVTSAILSGIHCIAVPNRFTIKHNFKLADFVINNLTENAKLI